MNVAPRVLLSAEQAAQFGFDSEPVATVRVQATVSVDTFQSDRQRHMGQSGGNGVPFGLAADLVIDGDHPWAGSHRFESAHELPARGDIGVLDLYAFQVRVLIGTEADAWVAAGFTSPALEAATATEP